MALRFGLSLQQPLDAVGVIDVTSERLRGGSSASSTHGWHAVLDSSWPSGIGTVARRRLSVKTSVSKAMATLATGSSPPVDPLPLTQQVPETVV